MSTIDTVLNYPPIMERIFEYLDIENIMSCVLVCRQWRTVGERPKFWSNESLKVTEDNCHDVIESRRITIVPEIWLDSVENSIEIFEFLFRALMENRLQLKRLFYFAFYEHQPELVDLSLLEADLLSKAIVKLEEFHLSATTCMIFPGELSSVQLNSIFTAIDQTQDLKLKILNICKDLRFSEVSSDIMASAVVKLEETDILKQDLTPTQIDCMFNKIAQSPIVKIRSFEESSMLQCSSVSPDVFGDALVRIETVVLRGRDDIVSQTKVSSLMRKIAVIEDMALRTLRLLWVNLSHIPPVIVSDAVVKLEELSVTRGLTDHLAKAILMKVGTSAGMKLKALTLKNDDLHSVPSETIAKAVSRLEKITLYNCDLSTSQLQSIFCQVAEGKSSKLEDISVSQNNVSQVPTELLLKALSRLVKVDLLNTKLTTAQLTGIYTMIAENKCEKLKCIFLGRNDHSSVPQSICNQARLNLSVIIS